MISNSKEIRKEAWAEYENRAHWTEEQQKCFMAGMAVMWRLCSPAPGPLFTYGPDSKPKELGSGEP